MSNISKIRVEESRKPITHTEVMELCEANKKATPKSSVFIHSIQNSRFVFKSGKSISFSKGVYVTDDEKEIEELKAAAKINATLSEYTSPIIEDGEGKEDGEDGNKDSNKNTNVPSKSFVK